MKYMGSKNRIAKYILPIMLEYRKEGQYWVEPFVGGANMIDKVEGNRIGSDSNPYLLKTLLFIRGNKRLIPLNNKEYTEEMYLKAKNMKSKELLKSPIDCFALFNYSFGSKFKGGWSRNKRGTDYVKECVKNILKQSENIQGVNFVEAEYQSLIIPPKSIIYCDPPYYGTTKYKVSFNHSEFWQWCRDKVKEGHMVFVSEYNAPEDFKYIWSKEVNNNMEKGCNTKKSFEKLFIYKDQRNEN